ncbi:type II secretion system protein F [Auraticoccus sp. F435]|uniref:Type II secretion system protein F n=1 Tax=Auraticoccus cholistanensis TaxID=2656650 RepID=A0A6A9UXZ7_9ACTN|nr:type II secretion system F family protein [Auraticoccus cholistanensis]MVA76534.1 type II secretion system protein F [Auraticoccus cholistanensis]
MTPPLALSPQLALGVLAIALAVLVVVYALLAPRSQRLPLARRRPGAAPGPGLLATATTQAAGLVERPLRRRGGAAAAAPLLERAGVKMAPQDLLLRVVGAALAALVLGSLLAGPLVGLLLAAAVPLAVKIALGVLETRRQKAFADQLEDSLQLMSSGLRAGHSLLQALNGVAQEAEQPTSEEFARIINETRLGRELGQSLEAAARRMDSEDFVWVTQAIAINREVGGNLAEVLDGVAHTIRERNQIRRQVQALSAEGRLSAYVLMALPVGVTLFLGVANPGYIARFTQSLVGYGLIGLSVVLMVVGALWLRKVVSFRF